MFSFLDDAKKLSLWLELSLLESPIDAPAAKCGIVKSVKTVVLTKPAI